MKSAGWSALWGVIVDRRSFKITWHFTRQVMIATGLFLIIGTAAVVLKVFHDWLILMHMPYQIIVITDYLEQFLFIIDVLGFGVSVIAETVSFCNEVIFEARRSIRRKSNFGGALDMAAKRDIVSAMGRREPA